MNGQSPAPVSPRHYINVNYGIRSWLLTTDHTRIALLYLISVTAFFFLGGLFAVLVRLELITPAGDLVRSETYHKFFTMHGVLMVFFFLIPAIPAVVVVHRLSLVSTGDSVQSKATAGAADRRGRRRLQSWRRRHARVRRRERLRRPII